jgi:trehalose-6-phosphate synthase
MIAEALSYDQLAILYAAADTLIVTSLSEGMNLVVKEFVAVGGWDADKLVVSRSAGVAEDLPRSVLIDPRRIDSITAALMRAIGGGAASAEEKERMTPPRFVARNATDWMREVLGELIYRF